MGRAAFVAILLLIAGVLNIIHGLVVHGEDVDHARSE